MVGYDYLSDDGKGWDRDVRQLAEWLNPQERRRVALCLHGWYDAIGSYCYDAPVAAFAGGLGRLWTDAQDRAHHGGDEAADATGPRAGIPRAAVLRRRPGRRQRRARLSRRLDLSRRPRQPDPRLARPGYVRADVLAQSRASGSRGLVPRLPEGAARDVRRGGRRLRVGRDLRVQDSVRSPRSRNRRTATGPCWRWSRNSRPAFTPAIRTRSSWRPIVRACSATFPATRWWPTGPIRIPRATPAPGRGACSPTGGTCCGAATGPRVTGLDNTRYGVETFGVPVAISNGWGDDRGPAEWTADERDQILELFRRRLQQPERVRYLTTDPAVAMQGDPLPAAEEGLVNWALAARGSQATASSEDAPRYPAAGAIDGVRDEQGWGTGHGWASQAEPRPHWLQITFPQPRPIRRFVVITYHQRRRHQHGADVGRAGLRNPSSRRPHGRLETVVT